MKINKWIRVTLTILLTLLVLAGVAGAGFRMGVMQSTNLTGSADGSVPFGQMRGFDNQRGSPRAGEPPMMQGFDQRNGPGMIQGFNHGGFGRGGRGGFFPPIFGLFHLAVLAALIWLGFKLVKNSGWRITRVAPTPAPTPAGSETPSVEVEEKKE